ncbi:MAG: hypothetical protein ACRD3J_19610, partial [Thermoanaerobaculia bacterium]
MQLEVEAMKVLAGPLLSAETAARFEQMQADLRTLRPRSTLAWQVPMGRPLETIGSGGEYEAKAGGKGAHVVTGKISFLWELEAGRSPIRTVMLKGNATTRIELVDMTTGHSLGMWRMEVGAEDGPGCCFHVQILGETADLPFPNSLPIPRLPTIPPTPMSALELVLGELFQTRWRDQVRSSTNTADMWRGVQQKRWTSFLTWQQDAVRRRGTS